MTGEPVSYDAETAGAIIGQSANWMKVHARKGDIPYTRVGRVMRWTPQQIAEILAAGEQRPRPMAASRAPVRRKGVAGKALGADVVTLESRPPRRRRTAA